MNCETCGRRFGKGDDADKCTRCSLVESMLPGYIQSDKGRAFAERALRKQRRGLASTLARKLRDMVPDAHYSAEETRQWIAARRRDGAPRSTAELIALFQDIHWCPKEQGGVR